MSHSYSYIIFNVVSNTWMVRVFNSVVITSQKEKTWTRYRFSSDSMYNDAYYAQTAKFIKEIAVWGEEEGEGEERDEGKGEEEEENGLHVILRG